MKCKLDIPNNHDESKVMKMIQNHKSFYYFPIAKSTQIKSLKTLGSTKVQLKVKSGVPNKGASESPKSKEEPKLSLENKVPAQKKQLEQNSKPEEPNKSDSESCMILETEATLKPAT